MSKLIRQVNKFVRSGNDRPTNLRLLSKIQLQAIKIDRVSEDLLRYYAYDPYLPLMIEAIKDDAHHLKDHCIIYLLKQDRDQLN